MNVIDRLKEALATPSFYVRTKDGKEAMLRDRGDQYAKKEWQEFCAANGGYDNIAMTGWVGGHAMAEAIDFIVRADQQSTPRPGDPVECQTCGASVKFGSCCDECTTPTDH